MTIKKMPEKNKLAGAKPSQSTQKYLDIAEIKADTVVLRDGGVRAVLLASSINLPLKAKTNKTPLFRRT